MIKLSGSLFIRSINGRNGMFSVGRLVTEIGEFAVKDTLLDQYEEGRYEGEFGVSKIYPSHYFAGGRLVVEIRATLETMALAEIGELPPNQVELSAEPDPLDSERPDTRPTPVPVPETAAEGLPSDFAESSAVERDIPEAADDERLFGTLWPLGETVRLDSTVDRGVFRRQKDRLKDLRYRFQPVGQVWVRS